MKELILKIICHEKPDTYRIQQYGFGMVELQQRFFLVMYNDENYGEEAAIQMAVKEKVLQLTIEGLEYKSHEIVEPINN